MINDEVEPQICFACDAEFAVHTPYNNIEQVNFCPFCGSEMESEDFEEEEEEDEDL